MDLALNDLQSLICHKTQPIKPIIIKSDDLQNETPIILNDSKVQRNHRIPVRQADLERVNNKGSLPNYGLCYPSRPQRENESERKER